jgi:hypothetical protein
MASERYAPAGLLVERHDRAIMIDGGPGAEPDRPVEDWLVTDERAELIAKIRRIARKQFGVRPRAGSASLDDVRIDAEPVVHTSRSTYGYRIQLGESMAAWAPEFLEFPEWAASARVMCADAAGWNRPIRFAKRVGGHAAALDVAEAAQAMNVARLVFAHVGKPTSVRSMLVTRFRLESLARKESRTSWLSWLSARRTLDVDRDPTSPLVISFLELKVGERYCFGRRPTDLDSIQRHHAE